MESSPRSVGISTKYLPTVLSVDMVYDGSGLVASRVPVAAEVHRGQAAPDEKSPDGETVLAELNKRARSTEDETLGDIDDWNYPIFHLACQTGGRVVSTLICQLFEDNNLFQELAIPRAKFTAYFEALENGYRENPYHNRIHAADVLQSMAYLLNTEVLGLNVLYNGAEAAMSVAGHDLAREYSRADLKTVLNDDDVRAGQPSCALRDALSPLELAACFIAAAQHDFDHPARTNSFLVSTKADLAILYNDRAVLEQHHAAASWKLLFDNPDLNFLSKMSAGDVRILRNLTLELILATDLAKHFDIIRQFKAQVARGSTFLKSREERLSIMQMCIKLADINGATKCGALHRKWAYLICEEFYDQGCEEVSRNLPISPYMDRRNPLVPKLQLSFIGTLLRPLLDAFSSAGFLPGPYELVDDSEVPPAEEDSQQSELGRLHNNLLSVIVRNTTQNEKFWNNVLKVEDEKKKAALQAAESQTSDSIRTQPKNGSAANG